MRLARPPDRTVLAGIYHRARELFVLRVIQRAETDAASGVNSERNYRSFWEPEVEGAMGQKMSFEEWLDSRPPEYREANERGRMMTPADIAERIKERANKLKVSVRAADKSWPGEQR